MDIVNGSPQKYDWTLQSTRSSSHRHPSKVDRSSIMSISDQADSSYEWWHMRWPTQNTWKIFYFCVFNPTSETFLSIKLWNLIISRSKRAKWHTSRLSIQNSPESLGQTMKQMINFSIMFAYAAYIFTIQKIKDNLKLLHNLRLKIEHETSFTFRLCTWSIVRIF